MDKKDLDGDCQTSPELDDLAEPLALCEIEPLSPGVELASPDGRAYRVECLTSSQGQRNIYKAFLDDETCTLELVEAASEEARKRLRHEAEVSAGLDCPMFPRILECFDVGERTYLAREPVNGSTLADAFASGSLTCPELVSVLAQVAFALSRLHDHGWVHLGLRPNCILLGKPVRVLDLSYATRIGHRPSGFFYHAGYSPPEILTEQAVDERADVYSLGAMLYHGVAGKPIPETGPELSTWTPPDPVPGVPQILHRCLGRAIETRYPSVMELHADLLRLAQRFAQTTTYEIGAATTIGLEPTRTANQDAYGHVTGTDAQDTDVASWAVLCVADGMGGMEAGETASEAAVTTVLKEAYSQLAGRPLPTPDEQSRSIKQWVHSANEAVCASLEKRGARGGTTLLCACLVGRRLAVAHVGDCRLYLVRHGVPWLLTRDHSLAMALAMQGEGSVHDVRYHPDRSKVTRSLGERVPMPEYYVDGLEQSPVECIPLQQGQDAEVQWVAGKGTLELQDGDVLLLCSDGLWEPVLDDEMAAMVSAPAASLQDAALMLLRTAVLRGAPDNATVLLLRVRLRPAWVGELQPSAQNIEEE